MKTLHILLAAVILVLTFSVWMETEVHKQFDGRLFTIMGICIIMVWTTIASFKMPKVKLPENNVQETTAIIVDTDTNFPNPKEDYKIVPHRVRTKPPVPNGVTRKAAVA